MYVNCSKDQQYRYIQNMIRDNTCVVLNAAAKLGDIYAFDYLVSRGAQPSRSLALHLPTEGPDDGKSVKMIIHLIEKHQFDVNDARMWKDYTRIILVVSRTTGRQ